ncbi:unnamed protein product [Leptosia nina]|uniref:Metalloendopeptidase n=1 Tax=Leptosia nina TaxID=320188 RepID=A0AAV1JG83_9NEOP
MTFMFAVILCALATVGASPSAARSRKEIEDYKQFLKASKASNGNGLLVFNKISPLANPEENSGKYQGDIILDDYMIEAMVDQYASGQNAYVWPETTWPDNVVVWEIGGDNLEHIHEAAILDAIEDIQNHTCIKFRLRQPGDTVYVKVTGNPGGCYAHVGYWEPRGEHQLNLAKNTPGVGCFRHATIVHEWMHILGFLHMQSTYNRDNYVQIMEKNIISGTEHNFEAYGKDLISNLDIDYDYVSCLHYSRYAFSSNGEPTIVALKEHEGTMGQRQYVTDKDWLRINRHYKCPGA